MELINLHTIKPLDTAAIVASLQKTGCAVTVEEHNIIGGMGDSVAQTAARNHPVPIEFVGTNDTFGESGKPADLLVKYLLIAMVKILPSIAYLRWYNCHIRRPDLILFIGLCWSKGG